MPFDAVPREIVTFSRIELLSPTTQVVSSPRNLRSCGFVEMLAPGKNSLLLPMRAPTWMVTLFYITVDVAERADDVVIAKLCFGMYVC